MANEELPTVLDIFAMVTGRALRADAKSHNRESSKAERYFHAGRREAYLQMIALILGKEVKDIRTSTLGTRHNCRKADESVKAFILDEHH